LGELLTSLGHFCQDDGCLRCADQLAGGWAQGYILFNGGEVKSRQGERFPRAVLALAQGLHSSSVSGIAHQVKAAQALDSQDFALRQPPPCSLQSLFTLGKLLTTCFEPNLRATNRAGNRLGVKAAVSGVVIFRGALWAECEARHAGIGPVIRDGLDDSKARTAVGAIDKRVAVAPIGWVKKFAPAIRADRQIRRNGQEVPRLILALANHESSINLRLRWLHLKAINMR